MHGKYKKTPFLVYTFFAVVLHFFFVLLLSHLDWKSAGLSQKTVLEIDPEFFVEDGDKLQVVETEESLNKNIPKETKYLGKQNQTVEKEMKASQVAKLRKSSSSQLRSLAPDFSLANIFPFSADGEKRKTSLAHKKSVAAESAANDDYLKDISKGANTLLNTKEFIYFGYYHRIREKLRSSWHTELYTVLRNYIRMGKKLAPNRNYITRLVVVLDREGRVHSVKVLGNSGAVELDDSAVEAFNRAGPFPNPPKGLIEKGFVRIRWDFVLQS